MRQGSLKILALVCVLLCVFNVTARRMAPETSSFDVRNYGAHADGVTDDSRVVFSSHELQSVKFL